MYKTLKVFIKGNDLINDSSSWNILKVLKLYIVCSNIYIYANLKDVYDRNWKRQRQENISFFKKSKWKPNKKLHACVCLCTEESLEDDQPAINEG